MRVTLNSTIRQTMITDTNDDEIAKSIHGNPKPCSSKDLKENSKDFKFEFEKIAVEETQKALQSLVEGSTFFSENPEQDLPVFRHEELGVGMKIGRGEFGFVSNVCGIQDAFRSFGGSITDSINDSMRHTTTDQDKSLKETVKSFLRRQKSEADDFPNGNTCDLRTYMMERCYREDTRPRFAVKRVRPDLSPDWTCVAIADLAKEAKFLASLHHSNIIRLRATVGTPGNNDFAIVLDRLYMILDKKIKEWKKDDKKTRLMNVCVLDGEKHRSLMTERLTAMYDIARALKYLHKKNIIFRDLKPENVGCDVRGDYKVFDFGLTRELRKKDMVNEDEYKITGLTGTRRWMAPENCQSKPYGLSADVYSFCLLFWHVISLKLPFKGYNQQEHMTRVAIGGEKPNPNKMRISQFLRNVVAEGWSTNTSERPKITRLAELMKLELIERRMDEKNKDARILDRSGYLMDQTIESYLAGQN